MGGSRKGGHVYNGGRKAHEPLARARLPLLAGPYAADAKHRHNAPVRYPSGVRPTPPSHVSVVPRAVPR